MTDNKIDWKQKLNEVAKEQNEKMEAEIAENPESYRARVNDFSGSISPEVYEKFVEEVNEMNRNNWNGADHFKVEENALKEIYDRIQDPDASDEDYVQANDELTMFPLAVNKRATLEIMLSGSPNSGLEVDYDPSNGEVKQVRYYAAWGSQPSINVVITDKTSPFYQLATEQAQLAVDTA